MKDIIDVIVEADPPPKTNEKKSIFSLTRQDQS